MSREPIEMRATGAYTVEFSGAAVLAACKALDVPYMRARFGKAWLVPQLHADDVCAWLEHAGHRLVVTL